MTYAATALIEPEPESSEYFQLQAPRRSTGSWRDAGTATAVATMIALGATRMESWEHPASEQLAMIAIAVTFGLFIGAIVWVLQLPGKGRVIELHADVLVLPAGWRNRKRVRVPYGSLVSIAAPAERVLIETKNRNFKYQGQIALEAFRAAVDARLAALPDGQERARAVTERSHILQYTSERGAVCTWTLIGVLTLCFLVQCAFGYPNDALNLIRVGAGSRTLIGNGQINRLFCSVFLHVNVLHLVSNSLGLWISGRKLEPVIGRHRFLLVFLLSGLVSSLATLLRPDAEVFIGASGGVFGIIAARGVEDLFFRRQMPIALRSQVIGTWTNDNWWLSIFFGLAASIWEPRINWVAHLAGAITGAIFVYAVVRRHSLAEVMRPSSRAIMGWAGALTGVYAAMFGLTMRYALNPTDVDMVRVALAEMQHGDPKTRADAARELLRCTSASPEDLAWAHAELASAMAHASGTEQRSLSAAVALADYRLGNLRAAIDRQIKLVDRDYQSNAVQSDLTRSLQKSRERFGVLQLEAATDYALQLSAAGPAALDVHLEPGLPNDVKLELFAVGERRGQLRGLLRIIVPPGATTYHIASTPSGPDSWPAETHFDLALVRLVARKPYDQSTDPWWRYMPLASPRPHN